MADDRTAELLDEMEDAGLARRPWFELFARYQPERMRLWFETRRKLRDECVELDPKTVEFIVVALDAAANWPQIDAHIDRAFDHGATIQELIDVCVIASNTKGPHALAAGLSGLDRVIEERTRAGKPVPRDRANAG